MVVNVPTEFTEIAGHYVARIGIMRIYKGLMMFVKRYAELERTQGHWTLTLADLYRGLLLGDMGLTSKEVLDALEHCAAILKERKVSGHTFAKLSKLAKAYRSCVLKEKRKKHKGQLEGGCGTCGGVVSLRDVKKPGGDENVLKSLIEIVKELKVYDLIANKFLKAKYDMRADVGFHDFVSALLDRALPRLAKNEEGVRNKMSALLKRMKDYVLTEVDLERRKYGIVVSSKGREYKMRKDVMQRYGFKRGGDFDMGEMMEEPERRRQPMQPQQMQPMQGQQPQMAYGVPPPAIQQQQQPSQAYYAAPPQPYYGPQQPGVQRIAVQDEGYCKNYANFGVGAGGVGIFLSACADCAGG